MAAIPSDLKKKAKDYETPSVDLLNTSIISSFREKTTLDLTDMRCKSYYQLFNESCIIEPTGIKKWKDDITPASQLPDPPNADYTYSLYS